MFCHPTTTTNKKNRKAERKLRHRRPLDSISLSILSICICKLHNLYLKVEKQIREKNSSHFEILFKRFDYVLAFFAFIFFFRLSEPFVAAFDYKYVYINK